MATIEVKNLFKVFGRNSRQALPLIDQGLSKEEVLQKTGCTIGINNASFNVRARETFVVMGLSGSGKSTVIRCLNRLIKPTRGQVLIDGEDIMEMDEARLFEVRRDKMSMVFQHFGLLPHRSVLKNTEFGLEISGADKTARTEKAMSSLALVGLKGYENSMPDELSGGMQQRVGLARALTNDPEVLLMDEAFSALDPLIRAQMQDELLDLQARMHKTIVFITHDLDEALKLGDRIAIMKDGAIVQIGTPEEILTQPADDYVAAFVQNVDRARVITAGSIMRKPQTITIPKDGPHVAVRLMRRTGASNVFAVDHERRLQGLIEIDDAVRLEREKRDDLTAILSRDVFATGLDTPVADLLATAITAKFPLAVENEEGQLVGMIDRPTILDEAYGDADETGAMRHLEESDPVSAADATPDTTGAAP